MARARYCSGACRARASKLRAVGVPVGLEAPDREDFDPDSHDLVIVTREVLARAGVSDTISGRLAVVMARQAIDPRQSAFGMVACIRQLEVCVAAALSSAKRYDGLDGILQSRDVKIRRALRDSAADDE
jgi:hypothetical protein